MPSRILILQGHPDPAGGHLCNALADAYAKRGRGADTKSDRSNWPTSKSLFCGPKPISRADRFHRRWKDAVDALRWAEHIVLIFPLWLGTMPGLVKLFLEQVFRPGVAFSYQEKGLPKKLLAGRTARIVVTMGMPAFAYRWFYFAHGVRGLKRSILQFVGIKPVRETLIGGVGSASEDKRAGWLAAMREHGRRAE